MAISTYKNQFELAKMFADAPDSKMGKLKLYRDLKKTENVKRNPRLKEWINRIIDKIKHYASELINRLPIFNKNLPEISQEQAKLLTDYVKTEDYKNEETFVIKQLGIEDLMHHPDRTKLLKEYEVLEKNLYKIYKDRPEKLSKVLENIKLSKDSNFIVNGRELKVFSANELQKFKSYLTDRGLSTDAVERNIMVDMNNSIPDSEKLCFVDTGWQAARDFLGLGQAPDLSKITSEQKTAEAKANIEQMIAESESKTDLLAELDKLGVKADMYYDIIHQKQFKDLKNGERTAAMKNLQENIRFQIQKMRDNNPKLLSMLATGISVNANIIKGSDEKNYYVTVPSSKGNVIAIPADIVHESKGNNNMYFTLPLSMDFQIVNPKTKKPALDNKGNVQTVSGADLIIDRNFNINTVLRYDNSIVMYKDKPMYTIQPRMSADDKRVLPFLCAVDNEKVVIVRNLDANATDVVIPDTVYVNDRQLPVVAIMDSAFSDTSLLKSVELGTNISEIQKSAFAHCSCLESIKGGASEVTVDECGFQDCEKLSKDKIEVNLKLDKDNIFIGCPLIEEHTVQNDMPINDYDVTGVSDDTENPINDHNENKISDDTEQIIDTDVCTESTINEIVHDIAMNLDAEHEMLFSDNLKDNIAETLNIAKETAKTEQEQAIQEEQKREKEPEHKGKVSTQPEKRIYADLGH